MDPNLDPAEIFHSIELAMESPMEWRRRKSLSSAVDSQRTIRKGSLARERRGTLFHHAREKLLNAPPTHRDIRTHIRLVRIFDIDVRN